MSLTGDSKGFDKPDVTPGQRIKAEVDSSDTGIVQNSGWNVLKMSN